MPLGRWSIQSIVVEPKFYYNPKRFWDADPNAARAVIPPGPNNPVGTAWIGLSKKHYGIHGSPEPATIGRSESHGCVNMTNWDVAKLTKMGSPGTPALLAP